MATTFGGVLSLSRRPLWHTCFTKVEELIGKAQIARGEQILRDNLQNKIRASPMDTTLNQAKVTGVGTNELLARPTHTSVDLWTSGTCIRWC
jgi:hypothetical protein